jgi:hypothetical protein
MNLDVLIPPSIPPDSKIRLIPIEVLEALYEESMVYGGIRTGMMYDFKDPPTPWCAYGLLHKAGIIPGRDATALYQYDSRQIGFTFIESDEAVLCACIRNGTHDGLLSVCQYEDWITALHDLLDNGRGPQFFSRRTSNPENI